MNIKRIQMPNKNDWSGYQGDLGVEYMRKKFFGKSWQEVIGEFGESRSIERADELLFCPRIVFQYYIQAFVQYIYCDRAKGDSDSAKAFLNLLKYREKSDPGSVSNILDYLEPVIEYATSNQEFFEAPVDIYGDFRDLAKEIRVLCQT